MHIVVYYSSIQELIPRYTYLFVDMRKWNFPHNLLTQANNQTLWFKNTFKEGYYNANNRHHFYKVLLLSKTISINVRPSKGKILIESIHVLYTFHKCRKDWRNGLIKHLKMRKWRDLTVSNWYLILLKWKWLNQYPTSISMPISLFYPSFTVVSSESMATPYIRFILFYRNRYIT